MKKKAMSLCKDLKEFGMPWEEQHGYGRAVRVDDNSAATTKRT
jgi:hypothetical protein